MASAVDKAYRAIREALQRGELGMGTRLRESELAERIGVSRTPIRQALRKLGSEGLVDFTDTQRAAVVFLTDKDASDMFHLRAIVEGHASRVAASRINEGNVTKLAELTAAMEKAASRKDLDQVSTLNSEFHQLIVSAADSPRLRQLMTGVVEILVVLRTFSQYSPRELARSVGHHWELIDAFKARDSDWAESVMRSHIYSARATYMRGEVNVTECRTQKRAPRR